MVSRSRSKQLGSSAEREYLHKYFSIGWGGCRIAGSGSMPVELPDVVIGYEIGRPIAVEIKVERNKTKYFGHQEVEDLKTFARKMNIECMIAIKFMGRGRGWREYFISELRETKTGLAADESAGSPIQTSTQRNKFEVA